MRDKTIKYTDEPLGDLKVIADFLPTLEKLVMKHEAVKVTLSLDKETVDFFKKEALNNHTQYQTMIKNLLRTYTPRYN